MKDRKITSLLVRVQQKKKKIGRAVKRPLIIIMALLLLSGLSVFQVDSNQAWAAENTAVKISQTDGYFAFAGDTGVNLAMSVENTGNKAITFQVKTGLSQSTGSIMEPNPSSAKIILEPGDSSEILILVDIAKTARLDTYRIPVMLIDGQDGSVIRSRDLELNIMKKSIPPGADDSGNYTYAPALDLVHKLSPTDSIMSGSVTNLSLSFFNSGNTTMRNAVVTLNLPEGISINNSSDSLSVGYISIGEGKTVVFPVVAGDKVETKNYPFTIEIDFKDQSNNTQSIKQTLYIPVQGSGSSDSLAGLSITDINVPKQVLAGEDFTLNFKVANMGSNGTGQVKIYTEPQSGIVNRTQNAFVEKDIKAGETKNYSVSFFTTNQTAETSYTIKLAVEPLSGESEGIQQYTAVYVKNIGSDSIKTPQLMVSGYSYGGSFVQAGDEFRLDLELRNTSSAHNLRNIKVTLESADGTFIPVRSSNSFFVDRIDKNGYANQNIFLSVKPDADQKTTSVNIAMSYEDTDGNAFTSTDVISIPVMQDTRLLVDDIIAPPEMYVGMPNGLSVDFYNMGRTRLNNLRINAEGNFDTMESNSYYVGNMEPGTEDSYDFSFMPREVGNMNGKIIFTYEDASGDQQRYEKDFEFQIMEMPVWDEEPFPPEGMPGGGKKIPWIPIVIALAVIAAVAIILIRRYRKKKMLKEMEIDE